MIDLPGRVGARLRQLRQARKLTQEELAEVERGRGNPTLTTLASLSEALGVGLVDLLGLEADRPRLSPRQASQVREALASIETLVELSSESGKVRRQKSKK